MNRRDCFKLLMGLPFVGRFLIGTDKNILPVSDNGTRFILDTNGDFFEDDSPYTFQGLPWVEDPEPSLPNIYDCPCGNPAHQLRPVKMRMS